MASIQNNKHITIGCHWPKIIIIFVEYYICRRDFIKPQLFASSTLLEEKKEKEFAWLQVLCSPAKYKDQIGFCILLRLERQGHDIVILFMSLLFQKIWNNREIINQDKTDIDFRLFRNSVIVNLVETDIGGQLGKFRNNRQPPNNGQFQFHFLTGLILIFAFLISYLRSN